MSKPKYTRPTLTSIGLPIKRAQGFETEGYCSAGNSAGALGGACNTGIAPEGTIQDSCTGGSYATITCSVGTLGGYGIDDGCSDGYTIYGGAPCTAGSNN